MDLKKYIRNIPDFPRPGIQFKDITPLLKDRLAFNNAIDSIAEKLKDKEIDLIVAPEARGFLIGSPLAYKMECGFVPVRKKGKLPAERISIEYELEYGTDFLEIHKDAIKPGQKVFIFDDLLATGGTIKSVISLVNKLGGEVIGLGFLIELSFLKGRDNLANYEVWSLINY